jgi:hypothetical protein
MLSNLWASPSDGRGAPGDVTTHGSRDGVVSAAQCTGEVASAGMGQIQTSSIDERWWKGHDPSQVQGVEGGCSRVAASCLDLLASMWRVVG